MSYGNQSHGIQVHEPQTNPPDRVNKQDVLHLIDVVIARFQQEVPGIDLGAAQERGFAHGVLETLRARVVAL